LLDGDIVFIKRYRNNSVYAVKILHQTLVPERATYEYIEIGSNSSPTQATTVTPLTIGSGLLIDGLRVQWSGGQIGLGYIYLTSRYWHPARYEIGVPFFRGNLEDYSRKVPANIHFESVP
jgi:hypothetical protein